MCGGLCRGQRLGARAACGVATPVGASHDHRNRGAGRPVGGVFGSGRHGSAGGPLPILSPRTCLAYPIAAGRPGPCWSTVSLVRAVRTSATVLDAAGVPSNVSPPTASAADTAQPPSDAPIAAACPPVGAATDAAAAAKSTSAASLTTASARSSRANPPNGATAPTTAAQPRSPRATAVVAPPGHPPPAAATPAEAATATATSSLSRTGGRPLPPLPRAAAPPAVTHDRVVAATSCELPAADATRGARRAASATATRVAAPRPTAGATAVATSAPATRAGEPTARGAAGAHKLQSSGSNVLQPGG